MTIDQAAKTTDTTAPQVARSGTAILGSLTLLGGILWLTYALSLSISRGEYVNESLMHAKLVYVISATAVMLLGGVLLGAGKVVEAVRGRKSSTSIDPSA